jgi:hypothetical protein
MSSGAELVDARTELVDARTERFREPSTPEEAEEASDVLSA